MLEEYINKASRFELIEAKDRIYGVLYSVLNGLARPCCALEELERIYDDIDADIEQIQKPPNEEEIAAKNPSYEDEE